MKGVLDPGSTPGISTKSIIKTLVKYKRMFSVSRRLASHTDLDYASDGDEYGFDRAMSKDMDNTVGDLRKRSK